MDRAGQQQKRQRGLRRLPLFSLMANGAGMRFSPAALPAPD
jgi:hypothetical protein